MMTRRQCRLLRLPQKTGAALKMLFKKLQLVGAGLLHAPDWYGQGSNGIVQLLLVEYSTHIPLLQVFTKNMWAEVEYLWNIPFDCQQNIPHS